METCYDIREDLLQRLLIVCPNLDRKRYAALRLDRLLNEVIIHLEEEAYHRGYDSGYDYGYDSGHERGFSSGRDYERE